MARMKMKTFGLHQSRTDERPSPKLRELPGYPLGDCEDGFRVTELDSNSVLLMPEAYYFPRDSDDVRFLESEWYDRGWAECWKTTLIYEEKIGESHPHILDFKGRDPWSAFPVLAKPPGLFLDAFITKHRSAMYSAPLNTTTSRIIPSYRPVVYQWALHLIDGLAFVHAHDVIIGDMHTSRIWLSSDSHLSVAPFGFLSASYVRDWGFGVFQPGSRFNNLNFHPLEGQDERRPTQQTDIFLFGCMLFQFMTGFWPANDVEGWSIINRPFDSPAWPLVPILEEVHMGRIVRQCWNGHFESAEQVKAAVVSLVRDSGWEIDEQCNLSDFDAASLFS
ncbi:hypothetical protein E8E13_001835 [Curvularia kusanoi]|uniref:Serine-threonine/tyrosine-protein kinase catalytic domain-containing protein n=1 Tax=Curvularia kusanoi TaxID=90978 RepID=A0A9P4T407_CURKU|nr:hypothetical protein E8E13_001835 [Curvularia kusanoi]